MKHGTLIKSYMKTQLAKNADWAVKGMLKIYERQTADEKASEETCHVNDIGFSGCDANILSSFSKQFLTKSYLSEKQLVFVFKKMPKYWAQLWSLISAEKQEAIVSKLLAAKNEKKDSIISEKGLTSLNG